MRIYNLSICRDAPCGYPVISGRSQGIAPIGSHILFNSVPSRVKGKKELYSNLNDPFNLEMQLMRLVECLPEWDACPNGTLARMGRLPIQTFFNPKSPI